MTVESMLCDSCGLPVSVSFFFLMIRRPPRATLLPDPTLVGAVTELTVGAVVSMTMFLALPRLPAAPGAASVRVALLVAEYLNVSAFRVCEGAGVLFRLAHCSPAPTL